MARHAFSANGSHLVGSGLEVWRAALGRFYRLGNILMAIDALLLIVVSLASTIVVFNTIQLTLYARRQAIEIMRLVGATGAFIRRPFLMEGMLQGAGGSLIGGIMLYVSFRLLSAHFEGIRFFTGQEFFLLLLFGVLLGFVGSWIAVQRFLKRLE